jgi:hypothetical protein
MKRQDLGIPEAVRIWRSGGVWNAVVVNRAVAVFGYTRKEAEQNLAAAYNAHLKGLGRTWN